MAHDEDDLLAKLTRFSEGVAPPFAQADTTDATTDGTGDANGTGGMNDTNVADDGAGFDVDEFLHGLDAIFARHEAATKAEPYLLDAMDLAENAGDLPGLLTVLNETMGFYRSQSRHKDNQWIIQRAIELALRLGLEGTEAWATTLINAATSQRAAGNYEQAEELYRQALDCADHVYDADDRRLAALHNNLSMLYGETDRPAQAVAELREALAILEHGSPDPDTDVDVASTCANLALALLAEATAGDNDADTTSAALDEARACASRALAIYRAADAEGSAHYASALATAAQVAFACGDFTGAVARYERALAIIGACYGEHTDYYRVTEANLGKAREALRAAGASAGEAAANARDENPQSAGMAGSGTTNDATGSGAAGTMIQASEASSSTAPSDAAASPRRSGLQLARDFWLAYGRPMLEERYPDYVGRIAAGLVGPGSECFGFDDALSEDHDFGARFCLWLTDDDYARIGEQLQRDYEALPREFDGVTRSATTPRASGGGRRDGVFPIGGFFTALTGYASAPGADEPHRWMMLDEATLANATNGRVFADPFGAFSKARQSFRMMPDDVRLAWISRRLGMIAQAGQYNVPRMLARGDGAAAWLCIDEFTMAVSSLVFLLNNPVTVGYAPYYKWRFAALRALSRRAGMRLAGVCDELEALLRRSSAACFGGAGFGEGGSGAAPHIEAVERTIEAICAQIVEELQRQGLTDSDADFLEWQRPYVEAHIHDPSPCLHSL